MPTIPKLETNRILTEPTQAPRASLPTSPSGTPGLDAMAQGMQSFGAGVSGFLDRRAKTEAEDAINQFERTKNTLLFDPKEGYYNKQGKDAVNGFEDVNKRLLESQTALRNGLSSDAQAYYDKIAEGLVINTQKDLSRHSSAQQKAWEMSTVRARVENTVENAAMYWNNPDQLRVQNQLGRDAVIEEGKLKGLSDEEINENAQTYDSNFAKSAIMAASANSAQSANDLYNKLKDIIEPPDRLVIESKLQSALEAEKRQANAAYALTFGQNVVDRFGDLPNARVVINEQLAKIKDPEMRKEATAEAMRQLDNHREARQEEQASIYDTMRNALASGATAAQLQADAPQQWERLTSKQKDSLRKGGQMKTDFASFSDLMLLPDAELAKVDPNEYAHKLAPTEFKQLINSVKSARGKLSSSAGGAAGKAFREAQVGRTRAAQVSDLMVRTFGNKSEWNSKKREKVDALYGIIDREVTNEEIRLGQPLTSQQFTDILNNVTRKAVQERQWWFDSETEITDIDQEELEVLSRFLQENGIPFTLENLIKAREQAK